MAKKPSSRGSSKASMPPQKSVRVRMYRVGFGDCFLLSLPTAAERGDGSFNHILIDFGVHSKGDIGTMNSIIQDIESETDGKLAIIISTHAHQDHISGFGRFLSSFSKFHVGQIWLPWTWDDNNPEARKLHERTDRVANKLSQRIVMLAASPERNAAIMALENLRGNDTAIRGLKSGFGDPGVKVKYLKAGETLSPESTNIPGLFTRILGPPDDEEFLTKMNPPIDQRYLALDSGMNDFVNTPPFDEKWIAAPGAEGVIRIPRSERQKLQELADFSLDLAFALDRARNNESLVVLFEFHNKNLLFTGDAQYGNWKWWVEKMPRSSEFLSEINFLKIAHHGSENATPKMALEKMVEGNFACMVSTQSNIWPSIPLASLMTRLNQKCKDKIVRSDWLPISGAPKPLPGAQPPEPSTLPKGFSDGSVWYDYKVDL